MTARPGIRLLEVAIAAALLLTARPVAGAEDGGTRSVFAQGTGGRALGMGGAFAAIADDATATMWNPAGLARVSRLELQASQTSFFDLGISESYLAVAKPDWRWGGASFTLRHFGVGDIERRDERNLLLDTDISDSQTEMGLGYGRPMGEAWSLGAVLKARHQSLGGLGASGLGLDVGVMGEPYALLGRYAPPWLRDVTAGFTLGNLIRPGMRLDQESVSDPRSVRLGFAWTCALSGMRTLLSALDFEKTSDVGLRPHLGFEMRVHPLLALRTGLRSGGLTAGTGLRWRDFSMDYAFENNPLGGVHRVGFNYAFGPTVAEDRVAATRAEEERVQGRLREAFEQREGEQVAGLLALAETHRAAGRFDQALELLATASAIAPDRAEVLGATAACERDKGRSLEASGDLAQALVAYGRALAIAPGDTAAAAGRQRCQAESNLRAARSAELRRQFGAAMDAFASGRLAVALRGFEAVLAGDSTDGDAKQMARRTRQAIARRVAGLLAQSDRYLQSGLFGEASDLLGQARALDPTSAGLTDAEARLARARGRTVEANRAAVTTPASEWPDRAAAKPGRAPSARDRREVELLYRRGQEAMNARRIEDALRYWELVWAIDPHFGHVADYLKQEYLTRGLEAFAAGRLDEAVSHWQRALKVDPNDQRARGYLARALEQRERTREILGADQ